MSAACRTPVNLAAALARLDLMEESLIQRITEHSIPPKGARVWDTRMKQWVTCDAGTWSDWNAMARSYTHWHPAEPAATEAPRD